VIRGQVVSSAKVPGFEGIQRGPFIQFAAPNEALVCVVPHFCEDADGELNRWIASIELVNAGESDEFQVDWEEETLLVDSQFATYTNDALDTEHVLPTYSFLELLKLWKHVLETGEEVSFELPLTLDEVPF
jgi:hypothetical protein